MRNLDRGAIAAGVAVLLLCAVAAYARPRHEDYHSRLSPRVTGHRYYSPRNDVRHVSGRRSRDEDLHRSRDEDAERLHPVEHGGTFGALLEQLMGYCNREVVELRNFPADAIAESVSPNDRQASALKDIRNRADDTADMLAASCTKDIPADPPSRLDAVDRGMDAVQAALNRLQPQLQRFYDSLTEEQRARLVVKYNPSGDKAASAGSTTAQRSRPTDSADVRRTSLPVTLRSCEQLEAELRAWPVAKIEQILALAPRQRSGFYDFAAALQHAGDMLEDSCPHESALTLIGRIEEMRAKLDVVRQLTAIIRPALGRLYQVLDDNQRSRFIALM
jgi:hypothetical protein